MESKGVREVRDAVAVAALCALVNGLIGVGIELLRRRLRLIPGPDDPTLAETTADDIARDSTEPSEEKPVS